MTYGEAFYHNKNVEITEGIDKYASRFEGLPRRMKRQEALLYYTGKLRKVFGVEEVYPRDFLSIDDYFDYFDAKKIKSKLKGK